MTQKRDRRPYETTRGTERGVWTRRVDMTSAAEERQSPFRCDERRCPSDPAGWPGLGGGGGRGGGGLAHQLYEACRNPGCRNGTVGRACAVAPSVPRRGLRSRWPRPARWPRGWWHQAPGAKHPKSQRLSRWQACEQVSRRGAWQRAGTELGLVVVVRQPAPKATSHCRAAVVVKRSSGCVQCNASQET